MAGAVGFEPTQHTGSKPAALPTRLHPNIYKTHNFVALTIWAICQKLDGVGVEPTLHKCVIRCMCLMVPELRLELRRLSDVNRVF